MHAKFRITVAAAALAMLGSVMPATEVAGTTAARGGSGDGRPNIILITTDDQRRDEIRSMPAVRKLVRNHGFDFTQALSPHPLCCPARAEILTGQYAQNNGVRHNNAPTGGYQALEGKQNTIGRWLRRTGYRTAFVGKYLNGYGGKQGRERGWTHWNPSLVGTYSYTDTNFFNDGDRTRHRGYVTDVVTRYTNRYIDQWAGRGRPFFVWVSHLAPHGAKQRGAKGTTPPVPAKRHEDTLEHVDNFAEGKPSFGVKSVEGRKRWSRKAERREQRWATGRLQSLRAVDQSVRRIVKKLARTDELRNTYLFFTSDNGFLLGEHRVHGKNNLYREALEVPLVVRVPGVHRRKRRDSPVTTVDLATTFLDLADARPVRRTVDGASFAPLLRGRSPDWRDTQLVQAGTARADTDWKGWHTRGVRTRRYTYGRDYIHGDTEYLFDRRDDPWEIRNRAGSPAYAAVLAQLRERTAQLRDCGGQDCDRSFGPVADPG